MLSLPTRPSTLTTTTATRTMTRTDARDHVTCDCSSYVVAGYIGPVGIVPTPALVPTSTGVFMVARARKASLADLWLPPLSPPPRLPFSRRS